MKTNQIHCGDCIEMLRKKIDPESIDLIFADPPYNLSGSKLDLKNNKTGGAYYKVDEEWDTFTKTDYAKFTFAWIEECKKVLKSNGFIRLAIANPKTAPYGRAAMEVLQNLRIFKNLSTHIIQGNNIAQTFQFVSTGNAELGFVSGSQVINIDPDLYWTIPLDLYSPIQQDAVLLHKGLDKKAAREFLEFLNSDPARKIIQSFGYDLE